MNEIRNESRKALPSNKQIETCNYYQLVGNRIVTMRERESEKETRRTTVFKWMTFASGHWWKSIDNHRDRNAPRFWYSVSNCRWTIINAYEKLTMILISISSNGTCNIEMGESEWHQYRMNNKIVNKTTVLRTVCGGKCVLVSGSLHVAHFEKCALPSTCLLKLISLPFSLSHSFHPGSISIDSRHRAHNSYFYLLEFIAVGPKR